MTPIKSTLENTVNPFNGWVPHEEYSMFLRGPTWLRDAARMGKIFPDLDTWDWDEP